MRILYLSLSYVPSRRASSVQVMKTCASFARRGHAVVLLAKDGGETTGDDFARYGVEASFEIQKIARPAWRGGGLVYAGGIASTLLARRRWAELVYCRDPIGALFATQLGLPTVFEAHEIPGARWLERALARTLRRCVATVAISEGLRRDLVERGVHPVERPILVAHDACDPPRRPAVARPLRSPPSIGYVGGLYPGRGIETIVALADQLPACAFTIVGGAEADLARWRAQRVPPNVRFVGFHTQTELPAFYADFDVLLMPYATTGILGASGRSDTSRWASPMKMFEYMASGVAFVSSDLPVLREVLRDGQNALIVPGGELAAWRSAIERLLSDDELRARLGRTAQQDIEREYTWDARAARVLDPIADHLYGDAKPGGST